MFVSTLNRGEKVFEVARQLGIAQVLPVNLGRTNKRPGSSDINGPDTFAILSSTHCNEPLPTLQR